jgi:hypothetical protein
MPRYAADLSVLFVFKTDVFVVDRIAEHTDGAGYDCLASRSPHVPQERCPGPLRIWRRSVRLDLRCFAFSPRLGWSLLPSLSTEAAPLGCLRSRLRRLLTRTADARNSVSGLLRADAEEFERRSAHRVD